MLMREVKPRMIVLLAHLALIALERVLLHQLDFAKEDTIVQQEANLKQKSKHRKATTHLRDRLFRFPALLALTPAVMARQLALDVKKESTVLIHKWTRLWNVQLVSTVQAEILRSQMVWPTTRSPVPQAHIEPLKVLNLYLNAFYVMVAMLVPSLVWLLVLYMPAKRASTAQLEQTHRILLTIARVISVPVQKGISVGLKQSRLLLALLALIFRTLEQEVKTSVFSVTLVCTALALAS